MTELNDGLAYAGQQKALLRLEGAPRLLTTTVTTGVVADPYLVTTNNINDFASRFSTTFDEYRIVGADVKVTPVTASSGISKMFFDEKSSAAPTLKNSEERTVVPMANTNAMSKSMRVFRWRAKDLLDLQYSPIGTPYTPVTFKVYTDAANYGAPIAVTNLWIVETVFIIEFRGIASA